MMLLRKVTRRSFGYTPYIWNSSSMFNRNKRTVKKIEGFENRVSKIVTGDNHSAILTVDGELYTWGDNKYGQLGLKQDSKKINSADEPSLVPYFKENNIKVVDLALGKHHTIVLDDKGRVFSWGRGIMSRVMGISILFPSALALGHPKLQNLSSPKPIAKFRGMPISQVSTGNHFALALAQNGELYAWGRGEFGVLGFENKEEKEPIANPYINDLVKGREGVSIKKIESCSDFSSILLSDGTVLGFGNNDQGNLGLGITQSVDMCDSIQIPMQMRFEEQEDLKIVDIDLAECTSAVKTEDGRIFFAGQKLYYYPQIFELDYNKHKVATFCSSDRGVAIVTEENRLFYRGNYWNEKKLEEDIDTGIIEADSASVFNNKRIAKVGGKYGVKWALIDER